MNSDVGETLLKCVSCGREYKPSPRLFRCPRCGGLLEVVLGNPTWRPKGRGVWRYRGLLPQTKISPVTMGEGSTPLIASRLHKGLYYKFEGSNPTGSFKDRGMTVATTIALENGASSVIAASTGNTASSMAAYASRAGLRPVIFLPRNKVAKGKILQSIAYGAAIVWVEGSFDDAISLAMKLTEEKQGYYPMNSFNPWRLEGQKTLYYEVFEDLGKPPDAMVYPVGNAGNISAGWKAAQELLMLGVADTVPRFLGVQARGASPIADAVSKGLEKPVFVDSPETVASAIRIGKPVNWPKALKAIKESKGTAVVVGDDEILQAQMTLARHEGIIVEPASAASYAGYLKMLEEGLVDRGDTVVLVLTGHGLKDPASLESMVSSEVIVKPSIDTNELDRVLSEIWQHSAAVEVQKGNDARKPYPLYQNIP